MGKNQSASNLTNIIRQDADGGIAFMSGSTMLMALSNTGQMSGSVPVLAASTASFVANAQSASYVLTAQTASYVLNAQSASYVLTAQTASFVANAQSASNAVSAQTASFANTFTVNSTLTAQTLVVQTITSSIDFVTGSTRFGSILGNTHVFSGSVTMNPGGLFISSSGFVGLNKLVPQRQYTQVANANGIVFTIQNADASNEGYIVGFDATGSTYTQLSDSANAAKVYLNSSGSSYINGGNVGIGTSTIYSQVHIQGGVQSDSLWGQMFISDNRAYNTTGLGGRISLGGTWATSNDITYFANIQGYKENTTYADYSGGLAFSTRVHSVGVFERMRITSAGNVGIGTSTFPSFSSSQQLTMKGNASSTNSVFQVQSYDSGTSLTVYSGAGASDDPALIYQKNLRFGSTTDTGLSGYTERMRISSTGVVTKPYQPFVIGGLDGNQTISSNTFTALNFSTTVGGFYFANVGGSWNNSTRAFTAPVTGVYMVNISLMTDSVGQLALFVNGVRKHSIPSWLGASSITWGGSATIPLTAGESLTLQGYGNAGTVTQNQYHTWFAIYLLG